MVEALDMSDFGNEEEEENNQTETTVDNSATPLDMSDFNERRASNTTSSDENNTSNLFSDLDEQNLSEEEDPFLNNQTSIQAKPIGSDMYEGMTLGQAKELYQFYLDQPTTEVDFLGQATYTDPNTNVTYKVDKPVGKVFGMEIPFSETPTGLGLFPDDVQAGTDPVPRYLTAIGGAAREMVQLGGAVVDLVTNNTILPDTNLSEGATSKETLTKFFPKQSYGSSWSDALITEIPIIIGSFFLGGSGATNLVKNAGKLKDKAFNNKVIKNFFSTPNGKLLAAVGKEINPLNNRLVQISPQKVAQFLAGDAAVAAVLPSDTSTLLFGENAMIDMPEMVDFSFKPGDEEYEKILAARGNIFLDGLIAAGILKGGVDATTTALGYLKKITAWPYAKLFGRNADPLEILGIRIADGDKQEIVRNALNDLANIKPNMTIEEIEEVSRSVATAIFQNKDAFIQFGKEGGAPVDVVLTAMDALSRADNIDELIKAKGIKIQTGIIANQKNLATEGAKPNALLALNQKLDELIGPDAQAKIAQGTVAINDLVNQIITKSEGSLVPIKGNVANLDKMVDETFLSNNSVTIGKLLDLNPTEVGAAKEANKDAIVNLLKLKYTEDKGKLYELFGKVKGGNISTSEWVNSLTKRLDVLNPKQFTLAADQLPNTPFKTLLELVQRKRNVTSRIVKGKKVEYANPKLETVKERNERVIKFFEKQGMDYAYFFQNIRPDLRTLANTFKKTPTNAGNTALFQTFKGLVDWLDEDGLKIAKKFSGKGKENKQFAADAQNAIAYMKNEFAPFWKDGGTGEFADIFDMTIGRTRPGSDVPFNQTTFQSETDSLIKNMIGSADTPKVNQLVKVLESTSDPNARNNVLEYIMQDNIIPMFSSLRDEFTKTGDIKNFDINSFEQALVKYGQILNKNFPDEAKLLDEYANNIRNNASDRNIVEAELAKAEQLVNTNRERVLNSTLGNFFQKNAIGEIDRTAPVTNGFEQFRKILTNESTARDVIGDILSRSGDNPLIREAMQTAYLMQLKTKVLDITQGSFGSRAVTQSTTTRIDEGTSQLIPLGRDLFSDKPEVMAGFEELIAIGDKITKNMRSKPVPTESGTSYLKETKAAANKIIYFTMGVLSSAGTKARVIASTVDDYARARQDAYVQTMDALFANADEFGRIALEVTEAGTLTPKVKQDIKKNFLKGLVFVDDDDQSTDNPIADQMSALFREGE